MANDSDVRAASGLPSKRKNLPKEVSPQ